MRHNDSFRLISREASGAWLVWIIIAMVIFWPYVLHAEMRVEAGYGKCRAGAPDDGTWQQRDYPRNVQLSDKCGELGLEFSTPLKDVSWGVHYVNLGQYATHAVANNDPQDKAALRHKLNADPNRPDCQRAFLEDCLYRWNGSGSIHGALFSIAWSPIHFGDFTLGAEAGVYVYKATWVMVIQPMQGNSWEYDYNQRTGWQRSPEFGAIARWKYLYLKARQFQVPDGAPITPGYRSPVRQFIAGVSIPF